MLACSSQNILRGVSGLAIEKFIINGDHIDICTSDVMNWWCPDPIHGTVSMCVKGNDVAFSAIINNVDVAFSALHIKAVVL